MFVLRRIHLLDRLWHQPDRDDQQQANAGGDVEYFGVPLNGSYKVAYPLLQADMDWLELRLTLAVHDINQEFREMSITGFQPGAIQAKLDEIKRQAAARRRAALSKLDAANAKVATVDVEIEKIAAQIEKEATTPCRRSR
jgi:hypothetical protein